MFSSTHVKQFIASVHKSNAYGLFLGLMAERELKNNRKEYKIL